MRKPRFDEGIIYFTVGALTGKFLELIFNIKPQNLWWLSFILGGALGLVILNRKRIFG